MPPKKSDASNAHKSILYKEGEKLPPIEDPDFFRRLLCIARGELDSIGGQAIRASPTIPVEDSISMLDNNNITNNNGVSASSPSNNSSFHSVKSVQKSESSPLNEALEEPPRSEYPSLSPAEKNTVLHLLTSYIALSLEQNNNSNTSSPYHTKYWRSLRLQVEVDFYVECILYMAERGFSAQKGCHLLQFLTRYRALVSSGAPGQLVTPPSLEVYDVEKKLAAPPEVPTSDKKEGKKEGSAKPAAGRRASLGKNSISGSEVALAQPPAAEGPQQVYEKALADELSHFVGYEREMRWRWENTPRVDAAGDTAGDKSGTSGKGAKKEKKTDKGKPPPLSEEEARHLATLAALPAENIFLSDEETTPFVDFFILKGMLQHSALYHGVQTHVPPSPEHRTTTVLWEAPLTVPSLDKATLVSPVPPFILAEVNAANAASAGATSGSKGTATPPPVEEKPVEVVRSPRSALQHTIETEMAIYERRYTEECAAKGNREKAAQLEKDMTLLLEKEGSTKAAQDVYTEMEDELNTRQTRILQRVAALEKVLNIKEETPEKK